MILLFRIGHFLSFDDIEDISFVKATYNGLDTHIIKQKTECLRSAMVFGPNGAGKTNLILGIEYMRRMVTGEEHTPLNSMSLLRLKHHVNNRVSNNKDNPSYFEMIFQENKGPDSKTYSYGFEYDSLRSRYTHEWLIQADERKDRILFERKNNSITTNTKNKFKEIKPADNLCNSIFNEISKDESEVEQAVDFIMKQMKSIHVLSYDTVDSVRIFADSRKLLKKIIDLSKDFTNISDYALKRSGNIEMDATLLDASKTYLCCTCNNQREELFELKMINGAWQRNDVEFIKNDKMNSMRYSRLSTGIRRILEIFMMFLGTDSSRTDDEKTGLLVIDEMCYSLHPLMTLKIMNVLYKSCENTNKQFLFTVHESELISFDVLRRDEIWFLDKQKNKSKIYALEEFKNLYSPFIRDSYLQGRFGAIPDFDDMRVD